MRLARGFLLSSMLLVLPFFSRMSVASAVDATNILMPHSNSGNTHANGRGDSIAIQLSPEKTYKERLRSLFRAMAGFSFLAHFIEDLLSRNSLERIGKLEEAVCAKTPSMNNTLRDALMIEVLHLLQKVEIFE